MQKVKIEYTDGSVVEALYPSAEELDKEWQDMQTAVEKFFPGFMSAFDIPMMED